jgi:tetratricopeptide (TPR) repeat protein
MTQASGEQTMLDPGKPAALMGQRVAFTGQFSTLTRAQAEKVVVRTGGQVVPGVNARATMLVVGMRGWPLMDSGHVPRKLADAERLRASGGTIRILSETGFREVIGLEEPAESAAKSISGKQVCRALGIDARMLQRWEHCGLVRSRDDQYDFRDLVSLRTVTGLVARGVSPVIIRKSLDALGAFLPGVDRPLAQLNILVGDSGELVAELEEALLTQSGQLEFRFDAHSPASPDESPRPLTLVQGDTRDGAAWIEVGLEYEAAGEQDKAEHAYRRAAALAPNDPVPQFNLGNVLLAAGRLEAATERYAQAVALDPSHAQAWFNLAHIQDALKDRHSAMKYLRRAIAADPTYADAHFNLAELAERVGDKAAAETAWDDYLKLDPRSEWSAEARRRLQNLRKPGRPAWA